MNKDDNECDIIKTGANAISTGHSSSELRVIGTNAHRIATFFLHLKMHPKCFKYVVQLIATR